MFLLLSFIILFGSFVNTAIINRVAVSSTYNVSQSNDVMGCLTNSSNAFNITVNLYAASLGSYVLCITDENGQASSNPITINTYPGDLIWPGGISSYSIESDSKTACFYSDASNSWHERRF